MTSRPAFTGESGWDHDGPLLFIAEVQNRLEKKLINACLDEVSGSCQGGPIDRVVLKVSGGKNKSGLGSLAEKLAAPGLTLLVPVRVSWVVPGDEGEKIEPLALRHLAFGDPREPGNLRGRWILHRDSNRAQCFSAQPATIDELKDRFVEQQGVDAADSPEDFAAFVARRTSCGCQAVPPSPARLACRSRSPSGA